MKKDLLIEKALSDGGLGLRQRAAPNVDGVNERKLKVALSVDPYAAGEPRLIEDLDIDQKARRELEGLEVIGHLNGTAVSLPEWVLLGGTLLPVDLVCPCLRCWGG